MICFEPKVAFKSILEEKPFKIILTSGTLGSKDQMEKIFGIKF